MSKRKIKGKRKTKQKRQKNDMWGNYDFDGDGFINAFDCNPLDPHKDGKLWEKFKGGAGKVKARAKAEPKFFKPIQEKYKKASKRKKKYVYGASYERQLAQKGFPAALKEKQKQRKAKAEKRKKAIHKAKKKTGRAIAKKYRDIQSAGLPEKYKRTRYKTVTRKYRTKSGETVTRTVRIPIGKYGVKPNIKIGKGKQKKKKVQSDFGDVDIMYGL